MDPFPACTSHVMQQDGHAAIKAIETAGLSHLTLRHAVAGQHASLSSSHGLRIFRTSSVNCQAFMQAFVQSQLDLNLSTVQVHLAGCFLACLSCTAHLQVGQQCAASVCVTV